MDICDTTRVKMINWDDGWKFENTYNRNLFIAIHFPERTNFTTYIIYMCVLFICLRIVDEGPWLTWLIAWTDNRQL